MKRPGKGLGGGRNGSVVAYSRVYEHNLQKLFPCSIHGKTSLQRTIRQKKQGLDLLYSLCEPSEASSLANGQIVGISSVCWFTLP